MKKILFPLLSLSLLVGCSTSVKNESRYCTYTTICEYDSASGWYKMEEPIKKDSIVSDTITNVVIKDGCIMIPNEHPEFNTLTLSMPDGKFKNAMKIGNSFKIPSSVKNASKIGMYNRKATPIYSDDINFEDFGAEPIKADGSLYRYSKFIRETLYIDKNLFSDMDIDEPLKKYDLLNDSGNDFNIYGVPAMNGKDAIIKVLEDLGFEQDRNGITECDLTAVGGDLTYYTNFYCFDLDDEQISNLSYGLFDDLKSFHYGDGSRECNVFLQWYQSGMVKSASIGICYGNGLTEEDAIEVNKRLLDMFGKSKVRQKRLGYMAYFNDFGIECYFPNSLPLIIERNNK